MQSIADIMPELNISPSTVNLGLVLFGTTITEIIPLSTNATALSTTIAAIDYPDSRTRTDLGIVQAHDMFDTTGRPNVPQHLVVITDGASAERRLTKVAVAAAKSDNITMHAMGVGSGINTDELNLIATNSSYLTIAPTFEDLKITLKEMVIALCG
ncbi:hypothetical protein LOTGIDRAFT_166656 [Lottia gigantea]|uniref:VWFA domain-containing protein n=1 Tax=Lottia gigantea TaxID=225164 RepID=V3Z7X2_LOTGI|nr:hypothetical protein LOTGIDRAFT_166656 [Lottia gigantea]ESO86928.1 hypothetical protein LOTGIDRAFT_166656 [Lottia gigantea]